MDKAKDGSILGTIAGLIVCCAAIWFIWNAIMAFGRGYGAGMRESQQAQECKSVPLDSR